MLETDPVFQRAVEILSQSRAPRDVFAAAGIELDRETLQRLGVSGSEDGSN